ncbi:MAG TPA: fimbrial protein [Xylella sp.]
MSIIKQIGAARITRYQERILQIMAASLAMLMAPSLQAACKINTDFIPQDIILNVKRVLIQPSLPIGGRIILLSYINKTGTYGSCDSNGGRLLARFAHPMTAVNGLKNVFETDVPGVGIRLYREAGNVSGGKASDDYPYEVDLRPNSNLYISDGYFQVELIKTAATTGSGSLSSNGLFTTYYIENIGPNRPVLTSTLVGSGITVVTSTCEVDFGSKNIAVNFGKVSSTTFNGIGSKGPDRDFAIKLICHGGNVAEADQGMISVRIDAAQDISKQPGVLAITPSKDTASGIGIELVDVLNGSEHQIEFGQGIELGKTSINASNTFTLPMRARYIQTQAGKVGPGAANGTATFTIEYK